MCFLRLLLGFVFVYASLDKIQNPADFARIIENWKLVPEILVNFLALVLPWVEFICGLALLAGQWVRSSASIVGCLLIIFIFGVSINLARGLDIDCGCFNTLAGRKIGLTLLAQDVFLLVAAIFLMIRAEDALGWRAFTGGSISKGRITLSQSRSTIAW